MYILIDLVKIGLLGNNNLSLDVAPVVMVNTSSFQGIITVKYTLTINFLLLFYIRNYQLLAVVLLSD